MADDLRNGRGAVTGHWAIYLGWMVRKGKLTREENDRRMCELMKWDKGGVKPEWMTDGPPPRVSLFDVP